MPSGRNRVATLLPKFNLKKLVLKMGSVPSKVLGMHAQRGAELMMASHGQAGLSCLEGLAAWQVKVSLESDTCSISAVAGARPQRRS